MRRLGETLENLERVVASRKGDPSARSYTSRLLAGGVPAIGAKVTEEAGELVAAAAGEQHEQVVDEIGRDVGLDRVEDELARRFGISGLDEKASRTAATAPHTATPTSPRTDGASS
ncbi:MAG: phosphoribosyl-ATP diphosphatase [Planctomycetia bacterium]